MDPLIYMAHMLVGDPAADMEEHIAVLPEPLLPIELPHEELPHELALGDCIHVRNTYRGSNRYVRRRTCLDCGHRVVIIMAE